MKLNASIIDHLQFRPEDIISIEPYTMIPILGQGIRINHRVESYKANVIFWSFKNPAFIINEIQQTGFLDNTKSRLSFADSQILQRQAQGGFPIKTSAAIIIVVSWNLLFLWDVLPFFLSDNHEGSPVGNGIKLGLLLAMAASVLTLYSDGFRNLILKEGREINDIRKFLYLLIFICGCMLVSLTFLFNAGN